MKRYIFSEQVLQPHTVLGVDCPATPRQGVDVIILYDMTITSRIVLSENLSDTIYIYYYYYYDCSYKH